MYDLPGYPGRGIAIHRHHDDHLEWIYVVTGRSEASRARTLLVDDDRVAVVPVGDGEHDQLRHYSCVRVVGAALVVGNGDHVDTIAEAVHAGADLQAAVAGIDPEPDPPILTPRIAVVAWRDPARPVTVIAVRDVAGVTERMIEQVDLAVGEGVLVHTYGGSVDPVVADARVHPFTVDQPGTDVAGRLWHGLAPELRVVLAVGLVAEAVPTRVLTERPTSTT